MMKKYLLLIICLVLMGCSGSGVKKEASEIKAPYDGKKFNNIEPFPDKSFWKVMKWRFSRNTKKWNEVKDQKFYKLSNHFSNELKISVIGHSTALIQINNVNILTDPQYSDRASPVSWAGPKRILKPAIKFEDLPPIDVVLISHDHYDHMDIGTLKKLSDKFAPKVLVGLGNKKLLDANGVRNVIDMDWWDEAIIKEMPIFFTPAQHWSARGIFDKRKTLWGGFYIKGNQNIFFAGDTGYGTGKVFKLIKEKYGAMDVGVIPIGAYEPRSFMKNTHINPEESVKIFQDLKMKKAIGVHFGTFEGLTDEARKQPGIDLKTAMEKRNLRVEDFIVPEFGKEYSF